MNNYQWIIWLIGNIFFSIGASYELNAHSGVVIFGAIILLGVLLSMRRI
jgi:hypothetical protein